MDSKQRILMNLKKLGMWAMETDKKLFVTLSKNLSAANFSIFSCKKTVPETLGQNLAV